MTKNGSKHTRPEKGVCERCRRRGYLPCVACSANEELQKKLAHIRQNAEVLRP